MSTFLGKHKVIADLSLLLTALIWGSGFIAVRIAGDAGMSAELILLCRFGLAAILVLAIFRKKVLSYTKTEFVYGLATGIFLFLPFYAQTVGIRHTSNSNSAFLTAVYVMLVPFMEWLVFKKRPKGRVFVCSFLATLGIGILTGINGAFALNTGDWFTLLGSLLFAVHIVCLGLATKKCNTEKLLFMQMATSAIMSLVCYIISSATTPAAPIDWLPSLSAVVYLGIFSTTLAYFIQTAAQQIASPSAVTILLSTEALFATIFSIMLGYEGLSGNLIIGGLIMMIAIVALDFRFKKSKSSASA